MHECWFENTLARLSALRIKKNLTETQVMMVRMMMVVRMMLKMKMWMGIMNKFLQAEDSGVGDE